MIQEDKQLLLKDLCGRLPYGVKIRYHYKRNDKVIDEDRKLDFSDVETLKYNNEHPQDDWCEISWKPYLRPMSSMTDKEREIFNYLCESRYFYSSNISGRNYDYYDWLNSNHFDYHDLIGKGLALEAPEEMYNN